MVSSSLLSVASLDCLVSVVCGLLAGRLAVDAGRGLAGRVLRVLLLLDHPHRALDALVGVVDRLVGLGLVGVEPRRDADLEIVQAQIGREGGGDLLAQFLRNLLFEAEQVVGRFLEVVRAAGEQPAVDVEDGDLVGLHVGDRRGDEVADRVADRAIVAAVGADDHRGGGRLLLAAERAFVGHDDMDARRLDAANHLDGARQLALHGADARHLLHERGQAERAELVVEFVADAAGMRQALFRQHHARRRGLPDRHRHRRPVGADVEIDPRFAQARADADDVVAVEAGIERLGRRPAEIIAGEAGRGEDGDADHRQRHQALAAQGEKIRRQPFDLRQCVVHLARARTPCRRDPGGAATPRGRFGDGACAGIARRRRAGAGLRSTPS